MTVRYPIIPDHYPIWVVGQVKPLEYRHYQTGDRKETPEYHRWTGDWGTQKL